MRNIEYFIGLQRAELAMWQILNENFDEKIWEFVKAVSAKLDELKQKEAA